MQIPDQQPDDDSRPGVPTPPRPPEGRSGVYEPPPVADVYDADDARPGVPTPPTPPEGRGIEEPPPPDA